MRTFLVTFLVSMGAAAVACTGFDNTDDNPCIDTGTCPSYGDAGDAGDAVAPVDAGDANAAVDGVAPEAGCDLAASPREAACVVDDAYGVFVSPNGSDSDGDGTRARPLATIGIAGKATTSARSRVFVCAGTYNAPVVLDVTTDGLGVYGGFDCAKWAYDAANVVTIAAPTGTSLSVSGLVAGVTIEDVALTAANASAPSESSVAVSVASSQHVTFRRVAITGGTGADGKADTSAPPLTPTAAKDGVTPADGSTSGGDAVSCDCPYGDTSTGGKGGDSTNASATDGASGTPGNTPNKGATTADFLGCSNGADGEPGATSADGATPKTLGALAGTPRVWTPAAGANGANGKTGQGGGGGGGKKSTTAGGGASGSGACGGCGGRGGPGGAAGGASIGLLVDTSDVTLEGASISSANAGAGAKGVAGQTGTSGGGGGGKAAHGNGCTGGTGGAGANGGAGGGGAGGLSAAIAYAGPAPKTDAATTLTPGTAGAAGKGGKPGTNDGLAGSAIPTFEIH